MTRRTLIAAPLFAAIPASRRACSAAADTSPRFSWRTLTSGPKHHFFGYYGIPPWNQSQKYLLCLETSFQHRLPDPAEEAEIGLVDAATGQFEKVAATRAWNLQQGAMLHWNPVSPETGILYNDRRGSEIISVALDVITGKSREFPRAINGVSPSGHHALCLTYGRLTRMRPVVGYPGTIDPNPKTPHPDNDGVFVMDLTTGRARLAVSIGEVFRRLEKQHPELRDRHMWLNHTVVNKDGARFFFLARCWTPPPPRQLESAMFTAAMDGTALREVVPFGKGVSHFEWRSATQIIATFRTTGEEKDHVLFTDGKQDYQVIGQGFLSGDGHCSVARDGNWMVTDRNWGSSLEKEILLYNLETAQGVRLGRFPMKEPRYFTGDVRCDLHPRWNRTGDQICIDALDPRDGTRQLHIATLEW